MKGRVIDGGVDGSIKGVRERAAVQPRHHAELSHADQYSDNTVLSSTILDRCPLM